MRSRAPSASALGFVVALFAAAPNASAGAGERGSPLPHLDRQVEIALSIERDRSAVPSSKQAELVEAVETFDGGRCFYASASDVGDEGRVEGFGVAVQPFERLEESIQRTLGFEPMISLSLIAESQCAVLDFLAGLRPYVETVPILTLESKWVRSGEFLRGEVTNTGDRQTSFLLIDEQGMVYDLDAHLRRVADRSEFNIRLVGFESDDPLPQLILTLASSSEADLTKPAEPEPAGTYFPALLKAIRDSGAKVGAAMKYFKVGG